MKITVGHTLHTTPPLTPRVMRTAALFGLDLDDRPTRTLIPDSTIRLPVGRGHVIVITGASGSGKSTLLRQIEDACIDAGHRLIRPDRLPDTDDVALVDALPGRLDDVLRHLAAAGLSDAYVMLRTPSMLSVGERHRFTIARTMALLAQADAPSIIAMDEFGAPLDRLTAQTIAHRFARLARRSKHTLIVATSHDDLIDAMHPDLLLHVDLDATLSVITPLRKPPRCHG